MDSWIINNTILTVVFLTTFLTIRTVFSRFIRSNVKNWSTQQKLRALNYIKSGTIIGFFLCTIYIWGEQIQGFILSVVALAFAMVFTIKETLTNLNGAFIRLQGHSYEVGDRICIKDYRGDVIDISLLTTTIMEVGKLNNNPIISGANNQVTGKKIVFPNSLLLTETVINESYLGYYQIMDFSLVFSRNEDWKKAVLILEKIVFEECSQFIEHARNKIKILEKIRSVELPQIEPKVSISLSEKEIVRVYIRCPVPCNYKEKLEQSIIIKFSDLYYEEKAKEDHAILPIVDIQLS